MKNTVISCLATGLLGVLLFTGCETRSISDSGYHHRNQFYRGELREFDVLGIERNPKITEEEIGKALDASGKIHLRKGSNVMLIQSGAYVPDDPMVKELSTSLVVVPFSGQPASTNGESFNKSLRLAAARGGCETILCYWGGLESARRELESKAISWVPVVGGIFPDENQMMRIRIKMALVDVRSGNWSMFVSQPFEMKSASGKYNRESSDQHQVQELKEKAYTAAARDLLRIYAN